MTPQPNRPTGCDIGALIPPRWQIPPDCKSATARIHGAGSTEPPSATIAHGGESSYNRAHFKGEHTVARTVIAGLDWLKANAGKELGHSEWRVMKFEDIVRFADATGDHQWIHVDQERIAKESPFGAPIAHGYFSVALIAGLFFEIVEVKGVSAVLNYGINKVRFPAPLKAGAKYRLALKLGEVKDISGGVEALLQAAIEIDGEPKPACAGEIVYRFIK